MNHNRADILTSKNKYTNSRDIITIRYGTQRGCQNTLFGYRRSNNNNNNDNSKMTIIIGRYCLRMSYALRSEVFDNGHGRTYLLSSDTRKPLPPLAVN